MESGELNQSLPRRQTGPSKQAQESNRITLVDELKAIEYRDDDYRLKEVHDTINEDAFNARQRRRSEILALLATKAPCCPKHSVKMICPKCIASSGAGPQPSTEIGYRVGVRWAGAERKMASAFHDRKTMT